MFNISDTNKTTLYSLQFLRFVAAMFVLLFHLELMSSGYKGVDIFFVISGFVMYYSNLIAKREDAVTFIINRLTKIYLLYWLVLLALYFIYTYNINSSFAGTVFLLPGHNRLLVVSWTLSYELYFYLIFGCVVFIANSKYYRPIFFVLLCISTFVTLLNTTPFSVKGSLVNFLAGQNFWEFLLGILCCALFTSYRMQASVAAVGFVVSFAGLALLNLTYGAPLSNIVYGCFSFSIVAFATMLEKKLLFNKRVAGLLKTLGDASYAIYLTGTIITSLINPGTFVLKVITIIIVIAISIAVNKLVENRLLSFVRKKLHLITHYA